jgi:uncharacterized sodium:solute symporter family permease YidK
MEFHCCCNVINTSFLFNAFSFPTHFILTFLFLTFILLFKISLVLYPGPLKLNGIYSISYLIVVTPDLKF